MKKTLFAFIAIAVLSTSCVKRVFSIKGQGPIVEKEINISTFDAIDLEGSMDVTVQYGATQKVILEGHENIIDRVKRDVKSGKWEIELKNGNYKDYELTIHITSPKIEEYGIAGSGNIDISSSGDLDHLDVSIAGSGDIDFKDTINVTGAVELSIAGSGAIDVLAHSKSVDASIAGSGTISIEGTTSTQDIAIAGSGQYKAFDLSSNSASISVSGSGDVEVNASSSLSVSSSGSGDVFYKGSPKTSISSSGSGSVNSVD